MNEPLGDLPALTIEELEEIAKALELHALVLAQQIAPAVGIPRQLLVVRSLQTAVSEAMIQATRQRTGPHWEPGPGIRRG